MLILITGAGRGLGFAIAGHLLEEGHKLALCYHHSKKSAESLVQKYPDQAFATEMNVLKPDSITKAFQKIHDHFNAPILGLINNAGIADPKDFLKITSTEWDEMQHIHARASFLTAQTCIPAMLKAQFGRIINISSIGGQIGGIYQPHYAAAKAAQINLTKSLARLYSAQGITSNAIAIGMVATDMLKAEMALPEMQSRINAIPLKRMGEPEEIAATISFLLSEKASYITGQTLNLNGGAYG